MWLARSCADACRSSASYRESGHEHFNGSVVIPIFDFSGQVVADVRAQDHAESARRDTPIICTCRDRIAGCGTKQALRRVERNHPVRSADRRADVLVRGLSQRDRDLRRERLYRGTPRGVPEARPKRVFIAYDRDEAGEKARRRSTPTN